jgi:hypothetical protein
MADATATGAVAGALGGALGSVAGQVIGAGLDALGGVAGRVLASGAADAADSAATTAASDGAASTAAASSTDPAIAAVNDTTSTAAEGDPLQTFAAASRTSDSRFASEYTSPSGEKYYDVNANRGPVPDDHPLGPLDHHGGCAEIGCLLQAATDEGPDAARGGFMRTIFNRPPNSPIPAGPPTGQGAPALPCPLCQPVLQERGITWPPLPG